MKEATLYEEDFKKVYSVTFRKYGDVLRETVWCGDDYIKVNDGPFLITEDEIDVYSKYGGGFDSLVYVGKIASKRLKK